MIGNLEDATFALKMHNEGDCSYLYSSEGSTRMVYLINGVIYKVEAWHGLNLAEFKVMNSRELPDGIYYPVSSLYSIGDDDVIAMEYIRGTAIYACFCEMSGDVCDDVCMTVQEINTLCRFVDDPSGRNVIRNDNGYWIIDAA